MNDFQMFLSTENLAEKVKETVPDIHPTDLTYVVEVLFEMRRICSAVGPVYGVRVCHSDQTGVKSLAYTEVLERAEVGTNDYLIFNKETGRWFAVGLSFGVPNNRFVSKVQIKKESKPDTVTISTKSCGLIFAGLVLLGALALAVF